MVKGWRWWWWRWRWCCRWGNWRYLRYTLDKIYPTSILYVWHIQISLHDDDNSIVRAGYIHNKTFMRYMYVKLHFMISWKLYRQLIKEYSNHELTCKSETLNSSSICIVQSDVLRSFFCRSKRFEQSYHQGNTKTSIQVMEAAWPTKI